MPLPRGVTGAVKHGGAKVCSGFRCDLENRNDIVVTTCYVGPKETAMPTSHPLPKSVPLNIRVKPELRNLIDRAAELVGKNRTDFMLEASQRAAEEALLNRLVFTVEPDVYAEFVARLDAAPQQNGRLRRTMTTKAPWDAA
jgi:uncharacterized protein (DUF1778 family)